MSIPSQTSPSSSQGPTGYSRQQRGDWGELLSDTVIAPAVLDRRLHHSHVLNIRGDSYRLRAKRQAGLFSSHHLLSSEPENSNDNHPD